MNDEVSSIGDSAFENCISLTSIDIPLAMTELGNNAFSDCTNLGLVKIPGNIRHIGSAAFNNCPVVTVDIQMRAVDTDIGDVISGVVDAENLPIVLFNPCGGTVSVGAKMVPSGNVIGQLPEPVRGKHTFSGWFTDKAYTT